ncbi:MAG TPA: hypothetical protein GX401_07805 [Clostridiales bacterium]|nr:hypothetical protein [Clostridiales bacterium]
MKEDFSPLDKSYPSCKPTNPCDCPKEVSQVIDMTTPIELKPTVTVGSIEIKCCDDPVVECKIDKYSKSIKLTVTQKLKVQIPIAYKITATTEDFTASCGKGCDCFKG